MGYNVITKWVAWLTNFWSPKNFEAKDEKLSRGQLVIDYLNLNSDEEEKEFWESVSEDWNVLKGFNLFAGKFCKEKLKYVIKYYSNFSKETIYSPIIL